MKHFSLSSKLNNNIKQHKTSVLLNIIEETKIESSKELYYRKSLYCHI